MIIPRRTGVQGRGGMAVEAKWDFAEDLKGGETGQVGV